MKSSKYKMFVLKKNVFKSKSANKELCKMVDEISKKKQTHN